MPSRHPEEWLKLFMQRTGMIPVPGSKLAHAISQAAADVRDEALVDAWNAYQAKGSKNDCAHEIEKLIHENKMRMTEKSLWGNDDNPPEEQCCKHAAEFDDGTRVLRIREKYCPICNYTAGRKP